MFVLIPSQVSYGFSFHHDDTSRELDNDSDFAGIYHESSLGERSAESDALIKEPGGGGGDPQAAFRCALVPRLRDIDEQHPSEGKLQAELAIGGREEGISYYDNLRRTSEAS